MQPLSRKLLLALPVSLLFSSLCIAQTSAIQGDVKGEDGKPLPGAVIKIERTDIKQNLNTKTDKKGHYFYGGLAVAGHYNVMLEVAGKLVDQTKDIQLTGAPADVNFDLKAAAAKAAGATPEEVERAMTPAQKADYEKKKKEAEASVAKNKELNEIFNAGMEAETDKKYDAAIDAFEKAVQIGPTQHVFWSHLADNYSSRSDGNEPAEAKAADLAKAGTDYQKAIEIEPREATYHNNFALILVKEKKVDEAKVELSKAAELDPGSAGKYYFNLGAVLANTNQNDAAGEAFQKAMAANYNEAYYQYGLVLLSKATTTADGKIIPAAGTVEAFQKYLEVAPQGPNAQAAKDLLGTLGAGVQTNFDKPGSKTAPKKK